MTTQRTSAWETKVGVNCELTVAASAVFNRRLKLQSWQGVGGGGSIECRPQPDREEVGHTQANQSQQTQTDQHNKPIRTRSKCV